MSGPSIQQFFPFGTDYMSWEDWNGNFLQWYGRESVPYHEEKDWQITAAAIAATPTFAVYPVPGPEGFETWQEWATLLAQIINGPST